MQVDRGRTREFSSVNDDYIAIIGLHERLLVFLFSEFLGCIPLAPTFLHQNLLLELILSTLKGVISHCDVKLGFNIDKVDESSLLLLDNAHVLVHFCTLFITDHEHVHDAFFLKSCQTALCVVDLQCPHKL